MNETPLIPPQPQADEPIANQSDLSDASKRQRVVEILSGLQALDTFDYPENKSVNLHAELDLGDIVSRLVRVNFGNELTAIPHKRYVFLCVGTAVGEKELFDSLETLLPTQPNPSQIKTQITLVDIHQDESATQHWENNAETDVSFHETGLINFLQQSILQQDTYDIVVLLGAEFLIDHDQIHGFREHLPEIFAPIVAKKGLVIIHQNPFAHYKSDWHQAGFSIIDIAARNSLTIALKQ